MSVPTPVTNRVIVDESGSTRKRKSTRNVPDWIQVNPCETFARASGVSDRSAKNAITEPTKESAIIAVANQPAFGSPIRLPNSNSTTAPKAGKAGISHARSRRFRASIVWGPTSRSEGPLGPRLAGWIDASSCRPLLASALQQIDIVGTDRLATTKDGDDDREPDRD